MHFRPVFKDLVISHSKLGTFCCWKVPFNVSLKHFNSFEVMDDLKLIHSLLTFPSSSTGTVRMNKQHSASVSLTSVCPTLPFFPDGLAGWPAGPLPAPSDGYWKWTKFHISEDLRSRLHSIVQVFLFKFIFP